MGNVWMTQPICPHCDQKLDGEDLDLSVEMGRCSLCNGDVVFNNVPIAEDMITYLNVGGDISWYCHTDRNLQERVAYLRGLTNGFQAYAWWKEGTQWVGSCGTRLQTALMTISDELDRLKNLATAGGRNEV